MKTQVYLSFNEGRSRYQCVRDLLARIGCESGLAGEDHILCGLYGRMFDSSDPSLDKVRELLRREAIRWSERIEHVYTDSELRDCPLLDLRVERTPLEAGGPNYGTSYDLSRACPCCGTGAVQISPLLLPLGGLPHKGLLCEAGDGEILVGPKLSEALKAAKVIGLEQRQVRFYRNNEPLPWWQMISSYEMPRMSKATRGIVRGSPPPCPNCARDGHYDAGRFPTEIAYNRNELGLDELPDVVHSWECFGKSVVKTEEPRSSHFASPLFLVRPKVFDIFRQLTVRHARFHPVHLVD